jgi:hypothetical protein
VGWADRQGLLEGLSFPPAGGGPLHSLPGTGANAHKTSLGSDHNPSRKNPKCDAGKILQVETGCGAWRYLWIPCNKWSCAKCSYYRLQHELRPELAKALEWARELGVTAKFMTFTWCRGTRASLPTPEGADRRRLDLQHLVQWFRRKGQVFEYLRISESHKSGAIHLHLVAVTAYAPQAVLSSQWETITGGSKIVDIEAVGFPCPRCWPGQRAPRKEKRASMVVPPPGRGECRRCGYAPDWSTPEPWAEVSLRASWEIAKYLTKSTVGTIGTRKCMNRSGAWRKRCQVKKPDPQGPCECCQSSHEVRYVGVRGALGDPEPLIWWSIEENVAYFAPGRGPCNCFGEGLNWRGSGAGTGLTDQLLCEVELAPGPGLHRQSQGDVHPLHKEGS